MVKQIKVLLFIFFLYIFLLTQCPKTSYLQVRLGSPLFTGHLTLYVHLLGHNVKKCRDG